MQHLAFSTTKTYTLAEIEDIAGKPATYSEVCETYSVVDVNGDFSQYDFTGEPSILTLICVDGEPVHNSRKKEKLEEE